MNDSPTKTTEPVSHHQRGSKVRQDLANQDRKHVVHQQYSLVTHAIEEERNDVADETKKQVIKTGLGNAKRNRYEIRRWDK